MQVRVNVFVCKGRETGLGLAMVWHFGVIFGYVARHRQKRVRASWFKSTLLREEESGVVSLHQGIVAIFLARGRCQPKIPLYRGYPSKRANRPPK